MEYAPARDVEQRTKGAANNNGDVFNDFIFLFQEFCFSVSCFRCMQQGGDVDQPVYQCGGFVNGEHLPAYNRHYSSVD